MIFQPFKHYYKQAVEDATWTGCTNFNKLEFLDAIHSIRSRTVKPSTVMSRWRQLGLIPFNPDIVLHKIRLTTPERRPTPTDTAPIQPKTSTTARATRQLAAEVYIIV